MPRGVWAFFSPRRVRQGMRSFDNPTAHLAFRQRIGRCYELAGQVTLHNLDATLVHGSIQGFGKPRLKHAWVQFPDGEVWEPATNQLWTATGFAGLFNPETDIVYENRLAIGLAVSSEHWGPYSDKELDTAHEFLRTLVRRPISTCAQRDDHFTRVA